MNTKIAANPHLNYQDWILTETQFNPAQLNYKETVFTIGNGYLSTRGSLEEGQYLSVKPFFPPLHPLQPLHKGACLPRQFS